MVRAFSWRDSFAAGAAGVTQVAGFLRAEGHEVTDLATVRLAQQRGIDLVVDDQLWEVKTDSHAWTGNVFCELTVGDKPGCLFQSRADILAIWFPRAGKLITVSLPDLQLFLFQHGQEFTRRTIRSAAGQRTWVAEGVIVPVTRLEALASYEVNTWLPCLPQPNPNPLVPQHPPEVATPPSSNAVRLTSWSS